MTKRVTIKLESNGQTVEATTENKLSIPRDNRPCVFDVIEALDAEVFDIGYSVPVTTNNDETGEDETWNKERYVSGMIKFNVNLNIVGTDEKKNTIWSSDVDIEVWAFIDGEVIPIIERCDKDHLDDIGNNIPGHFSYNEKRKFIYEELPKRIWIANERIEKERDKVIKSC